MRDSSRIQSFFIELAAVILFFSFAAAIDLRLFAAGSSLSRDSQDLNGAVLAAQSIADAIAAGERPEEAALTLYFDGDWVPAAEEAAFSARILTETEQTGAGELTRHTIALSRADGELLYTLETARYWPAGE